MRGLLARSLWALLRPLVQAALRIGFGLRIRGQGNVPGRTGVIFAANHISFLDPVVVAVVCPASAVFLARRALFRIWWLGPVLRFFGAIQVDRGRTEIGLRRAVRLLRGGRSVVIFPEGGRQISGALGKAKPGVAFLACAARAPIVPVLLRGTDQALPPGARRLHRAKIEVAFGPEIRYPTGRLSPEICERLAQQVTAGWQRLRDSCTDTPHGHDNVGS